MTNKEALEVLASLDGLLGNWRDGDPTINLSIEGRLTRNRQIDINAV